MKIRGRPIKFNDFELKEILLAYVVKNKGKVNYLQLEKTTGVKRHIWMRRMGEEIKKINSPVARNYGVSKDVPLPNVEDLIDQYGDNKAGLIRALGHLNEVIMTLFEQNEKYRSEYENITDLTNAITEKDEEIRRLKKDVKHYKEKYEQAYVQSTYNSLKNTEGLKDNLISIDFNKEKSLSTDFEKQFPELFT